MTIGGPIWYREHDRFPEKTIVLGVPGVADIIPPTEADGIVNMFDFAESAEHRPEGSTP
ncbi:MAG: hypothetical protein KAJ52_05830 [Sedimentisphaerales bacterium]|nr:hypothetical protein [Sedimentisphaerales bacterium]